MTLIEDTELASMRGTAAQALDGTAVFQRKAWVSDGGGGGTTTWSAGGTVPCRLAPIATGGKEAESVTAGRLSADSQVLFTFPAETDVGHEDQIVYGGGTFSVTAIRLRSVELTRRVEAKEVE